jgi:hypothetical protein
MAELLHFKRPSTTYIRCEDSMEMVQPRSLLDRWHSRILCVGNDLELLSTRCALLSFEGYGTGWSSPARVKQIFQQGDFQLVILCITLEEHQRRWVRASVPAGTKLLSVEQLIMPEDLLCVVRHILRKNSPCG